MNCVFRNIYFGIRFTIAMFLSFAMTASLAAADEIDACMSNLQKQYEAPQEFSQPGEITCGSADVVGFPPRIRRHDASGSVSFTAPDGMVIRNRSVNAIQIENVSQNNGRFGSPSVSADNRTVTVPISCDGKGIGEGRAWQSIKIHGTIVKLPTPNDQKSWAIICVKCVAAGTCTKPE